MPQIPFDPLPTVAPVGAPGVFEHIDTNAEQFGSTVADATMGLGRATSALGDTLHAAAMASQHNANQLAVEQANTQNENLKAAVLHGPNGFYSLNGSDAVNAADPTARQIEDIRQQVGSTLANGEQQRMYDVITRRNTVIDIDRMLQHADSQYQVAKVRTIDGALGTAVNSTVSYKYDNGLFAQRLGDIKLLAADRTRAVLGESASDDAIKAAQTHYTGEAWTARLTAVAGDDPNLAMQMLEANADQIPATHYGSLYARLSSAQWTQMARDESLQRRSDAQAQRDMQATQAGNLASLTADVLQGKMPNSMQLADLVRTQQIAPHVPDFLMSLQKRRAAGPEQDRADAVIALHTLLNDPSATVDDKTNAIRDAAHHGAITAATAGTFVDQAYRSDGRAESSTERDAKAAVLAAGGVPDGFINLDHDERQRKAQILTEWQSRMLKGEDPMDVRDDMIAKYTPPGVPPATWARPRFGPVASTADVATVAAKTKQALADGQITQDQARSEGVLLNQYNGFYQQLESARAAAAAAQAKKPQPGGAKAKVRGVTQDQ